VNTYAAIFQAERLVDFAPDLRFGSSVGVDLREDFGPAFAQLGLQYGFGWLDQEASYAYTRGAFGAGVRLSPRLDILAEGSSMTFGGLDELRHLAAAGFRYSLGAASLAAMLKAPMRPGYLKETPEVMHGSVDVSVAF
jgi:hypothetical protein